MSSVLLAVILRFDACLGVQGVLLDPDAVLFVVTVGRVLLVADDPADFIVIGQVSPNSLILNE